MTIPSDLSTNETARWIWEHLVPTSGQSDTVQGELLRAVERLSWEAQNNGNANWDSGFEHLISFLDSQLGQCLQLQPHTRASVVSDLKRLRDFERPYTDDDLYDRLTDAVVAFAKAFPDPIHRGRDLELHR